MKPAYLNKKRVDEVTELLSRVSKENGDLYDTLGIIAQDILEAKERKPGQIADLLASVTTLEVQIKSEFNVNEPTIWDEWEKAKKDDVPYDIEKAAKALKPVAYDKTVEKALDLAVQLSRIYDVPNAVLLKDMFDYLAIIILETIDNFYDYDKSPKKIENLKELQRVLTEYQRFVACLKHVEEAFSELNKK
jgi:hypothetical protein